MKQIITIRHGQVRNVGTIARVGWGVYFSDFVITVTVLLLFDI